MHFVRVTSTAAVFLLFGALVPAFAQHEEKEEKRANPQQQQHAQEPQHARPQQQQRAQQPQHARPQQQERAQQPQHARPEQQQRAQQPQQQRQQQQVQRNQQQRQQQQRNQQARQSQPQQQQRQYQPQQRTRQQAVAWQQQRGWAPQGSWQPHNNWQESRSQNWSGDHRDWGQRGGYGGYYISQSVFSISFGSRHWFRMHSRPYMYMGYPRFSYGGYSFLLLDPWPYEWGDNWYASNDLYIDYDDGYYLYNRRYPSMGLAISVVM